MKIAVGGFIGAGKSTLSRMLANHFGIKHVEEYSTQDPKQKESFETLLKWKNEGRKFGAEIFQIYTLIQSATRQLESKEEDYVIDRDLPEHLIFAEKSLVQDSLEKAFYTIMYELYIHLIDAPDLYIILDLSWETFVKRMQERNREEEVLHFEEMKDALYDLHKNYIPELVKFLKEQEIEIIIVNTDNKSIEEVFNTILHRILARNS